MINGLLRFKQFCNSRVLMCFRPAELTTRLSQERLEQHWTDVKSGNLNNKSSSSILMDIPQFEADRATFS